MGTLSTNRPVAAYNCTQQELYSVGKIGWTSFLEHEAAFAVFSTKYISPYGTTMKAAVQSAKALPDEFARADEHKSLRIELISLGNDCQIIWQQLTSFIRDGFSKELYETKISAAGHEYYAGASGKDWESVSGLMEAGKAFIADNSAVLTTPGGMPVGFDTAFDAAKTAFDTKYEAFTDMEQDMQEATDTKINANNTVYSNLTSMFEDGQKIFRNNPSVKDRFVFDKVLALISSGGGTTPDTGDVNGGTVDNIYGPTSEDYVAGVTMKIKNTTPIGSSASDIVTLGFYPAHNPGDGFPGGSSAVQLTNEQEIELTIPVADFKAYFNVHNMSGLAGSWEIRIV